MNPLTDPDCQALLADLRAITTRANELSRRVDREYCAVGKLWGVTRGLREALDSAARLAIQYREGRTAGGLAEWCDGADLG